MIGKGLLKMIRIAPGLAMTEYMGFLLENAILLNILERL